MKKNEHTIGCIGQGYVGKNYADEFAARGIPVVRYSLEEEFIGNKSRIKDCDVVVIAVPTPTTPIGFDLQYVSEAIGLVGEGKVAVIKSTVTPGSTSKLQEQYPNRILFFSPEFLSEATAAHDVAHPFMSIVGMAKESDAHKKWAPYLLELFPDAPYSNICSSTEAELIKYAHNGNGYLQVLFFNILYDLAQSLGASWHTIQNAVIADPFVSDFYSQPIHKSGRGAGGHCFIKDFAALRELYERELPTDSEGSELLRAAEAKNKKLLVSTNKDLDLLKGVYGSGDL